VIRAVAVRAAIAFVVVGAVVVTTAGIGSAGSKDDLAAVRRATVGFHDPSASEAAGYHPFLDCFDAPEGGMGQHFVDMDALGAAGVDAERPEALVYEIAANGKLRLVAVEYIVPNSPAVAVDPPELFGQDFHLVPSLDVWVLHAWVWRNNPAGTFADWNRTVAPCPDNGS
jgi:hypothetical protein